MILVDQLKEILSSFMSFQHFMPLKRQKLQLWRTLLHSEIHSFICINHKLGVFAQAVQSRKFLPNSREWDGGSYLAATRVWRPPPALHPWQQALKGTPDVLNLQLHSKGQLYQVNNSNHAHTDWKMPRTIWRWIIPSRYNASINPASQSLAINQCHHEYV